MRIPMALVLFLLISGSAAAQGPATPDLLGVYFDEAATEICLTTNSPFQQVTAYLIVSNVSDPGGIGGWECQVSVLGNPVAPSWELSAGLNVADSAMGLFDVGIGLVPDALPPAPTIILATWRGYVMSPTDHVEWTIFPYPGSVSFDDTPGYASGNTPGLLTPLVSSAGQPYGAPAAMVWHACSGLPNETRNWGHVKSLFR